jgi:pimeloyl-ACP methyl ester carboxylesterase
MSVQKVDTPATKRKSPIRRYAIRLALVPPILYLLICLLLYLFQGSLVFPGSYRQGTSNVQIAATQDTQLLHLTSAANIPLTGLFGKALLPANEIAHAAECPTILYFYGNGDALPTALYHFDLFRHLGANCIIIDYEGYGLSGGTPSEQGCYRAAEAAYQYLRTRTDINTHNFIPAGFSLGGAVAIDLAWRHKNDHTISGLITFSTFDTLRDMAARNYPWFPVTTLLKYSFNSQAKAAELSLPWFIAHGMQDTAIPPACADRLAAAASNAGARITRFACRDGTHIHFFDRAQRDLLPALDQFLKQF